jgi:hypothetical protein
MMAVPGYDFLSRILGNQPSNGPVMAPTPTTAAVAAPTMQQAQQSDFNNAMLGRMGQLGMLFLAAGQKLTPAQRATILAQAPQYMDGVQADMYNAAQARYMDARQQEALKEQERQDAIRAKLADPKVQSALGIKPEMMDVLGVDGVKKMLVDQLQSNTPDAVLNRQRVQAEINHLNRPPAPEAPTVVELSDGRKAILQRGSTTPIPLEPPLQSSNVPPGVDPQKWRDTQTKAAADQQAKALEAEKILPNVIRARQAYEGGQGYIGPVQSSSPYRTMQGIFGRPAETKRSDIDNKLAKYQKALVIQNLPPGAASDKDIAEARRGMASISDTSPISGLASIDGDISSTLGMMGYNVPPAHISELIRDIKTQNAEGVRQFIEAHKGGDKIVSMIGGSL